MWRQETPKKTDLPYCVQNVWLAILIPVGSNTKVHLAGIFVGLKSLSDALAKVSKHDAICVANKAHPGLGLVDQLEQQTT